MRRSKEEEEEETKVPSPVDAGNESDGWRLIRERSEAEVKDHGLSKLDLIEERRWASEEKNTKHFAEEWLRCCLTANDKVRVVYYTSIPPATEDTQYAKLMNVVYRGASVEFVNADPWRGPISTLCCYDNVEALANLKFVNRGESLKEMYMRGCLRSPTASFRAAGFLFARLFGGKDNTSSIRADDCVYYWIDGFSSLKAAPSWFSKEPLGPEYTAEGEGHLSTFVTAGRYAIDVPEEFRARASVFKQTSNATTFGRFLYQNQASKLNALCDFFGAGVVLYAFCKTRGVIRREGSHVIGHQALQAALTLAETVCSIVIGNVWETPQDAMTRYQVQKENKRSSDDMSDVPSLEKKPRTIDLTKDEEEEEEQGPEAQ